ncbi:hypothetical protein LJB75_01240, partial [Bacteroidales bacterium OttesenSCG-928-L19]|nr:hypothetical protein [Bacteroidales bacterium OttesenSCG-928-L19]
MEKRVFIRDHFIYDNLDRLTYFGAMKKTPIGGIIDNIYHDTQGNITSTPYTGNYTCEIQLFNYSIIQLLTAYTGDYTYEINTSKPHAVEQVTLTSANSSKISASDCAV